MLPTLTYCLKYVDWYSDVYGPHTNHKFFLHRDPWLKGPYQLISHASGHLVAGSDSDRIIALIGFDQAIEVCVDVFINLHPRLRGNYIVSKEDVAKLANNFYAKIEFLEKYAAGQGVIDLPGNQMVWQRPLYLRCSYHEV